MLSTRHITSKLLAVLLNLERNKGRQEYSANALTCDSLKPNQGSGSELTEKAATEGVNAL